jgi:hypothetical protein
MAAAEIIRRMVWGFFRLEWEYIEKYGSAPVPTSQLEQLEIEKSFMNQRKEKSSIQPSFPSSISSLSPMNISTSSSKRKSNSPSLFGYCWRMARHESGDDWEWFEYFGLAPERMVSDEVLRNFVPNELSRTKWMARVIEGAGLCSIVIGMIIYAISIGEYES